MWWAGTEPPAALVGPTRRAQVALLVLVAVLAAVVLPRWGPPNPSADGPPVAVAVSLVDGPGLAVGYGLPVVWVTLGRDGPVEVELDTGSVGLRVLASALPHGRRSGIHVTAADDVVEYGDGTVLDSLVADATLGLGGVRSSGPVAFGLVQKVVCDPSVVDCPAADRQAPFGDPTIQGILGVGLDWPEGAPQVVNPLTELPGRYARSWSLALQNGASGGGGALVLGAPEPAHPAALFQLQKQGADATGAETYSDYPSACWAVDRVRTCGETLFDSGTEAMFLDGAFGSVGTGAIDGLRLVDPRSTVSAACDPRTRPRTCSSTHPFWRFSAGGTIGRNAVLVTKDAGFVNSGVQAFFDFTITYDDAAGRIYLVPQP